MAWLDRQMDGQGEPELTQSNSWTRTRLSGKTVAFHRVCQVLLVRMATLSCIWPDTGQPLGLW